MLDYNNSYEKVRTKQEQKKKKPNTGAGHLEKFIKSHAADVIDEGDGDVFEV